MRRVTAAVVVAVAAVLLGVVGATSADAAGGVMIYRAYYNSPGSDTGSNASLNGEYILLKNTSTATKTITSWTLRDKQNHVYKFPATSIGAGKYLYVHTGTGGNNASTRYWGSRAYIWNNTGDAAYLRTSTGGLVDSCSWGSSGSYKNC